MMPEYLELKDLKTEYTTFACAHCGGEPKVSLLFYKTPIILSSKLLYNLEAHFVCCSRGNTAVKKVRTIDSIKQLKEIFDATIQKALAYWEEKNHKEILDLAQTFD